MEKILYNKYRVSKNGEVFSLTKNRKMKTSLNHKGYEQIYIMVDGKKKTTFVHRMVAIAYIPNPDNLPQVNHKDGNKLNNNVENLEWISDKRNQEHAFKNNLKANQKKPVRMTHSITGEVKDFDSIKACATYLSTKQYSISRVCSGIRKAYKGYYIEYR